MTDTAQPLLTIDDIAQMHHCSLRHARSLVKIPGFPEEAPTSTPRNRLWLRSEVRAYVHRKPPIPAQIPQSSSQAA